MSKSIPIVSSPGNYCAFNRRESPPYRITRAEAASGLREMRKRERRGSALIKRNGRGSYTISGLNTLVLTTR
jgi:hypothetical protein